MDRPRQSDLRGLLDFVAEAEAAALSDRAQLGELILSGLTRLLPCDSAVAVEVRLPRGIVTTTATDEGLATARRRDLDLWIACLPHHPTVTHWQRTGGGAAVRFSDLLSRRALQRLPIYHYFWRPFGVEYDVGARVGLARDHFLDIGCTRGRRDFSDDERVLLEALRPYLAAILRRAEVGTLAGELRSAFPLSRREAEVVALVARGKSNAEIAAVLFLSPGTVRKHLERICAKLGLSTRTQVAAHALRATRRSREGDQALGELLGRQLERTGRSKSALSLRVAFGLTSREADVLELIADGRSNAEIGAALALAPGTVKKHLEHVYEKLGVSRRAEAAARALTLGFAGGKGVPDRAVA